MVFFRRAFRCQGDRERRLIFTGTSCVSLHACWRNEWRAAAGEAGLLNGWLNAEASLSDVRVDRLTAAEP